MQVIKEKEGKGKGNKGSTNLRLCGGIEQLTDNKEGDVMTSQVGKDIVGGIDQPDALHLEPRLLQGLALGTCSKVFAVFQVAARESPLAYIILGAKWRGQFCVRINRVYSK